MAAPNGPSHHNHPCISVKNLSFRMLVLGLVLCLVQGTTTDVPSSVKVSVGKITPSAATGVSCTSGQWRCSNRKECVPTPYRCNGVVDCTDESDEDDCSTEPACQIKGPAFLCGDNECVPSSYRCNGEVDCSNGFDELDCGSWVPWNVSLLLGFCSLLGSSLLAVLIRNSDHNGDLLMLHALFAKEVYETPSTNRSRKSIPFPWKHFGSELEGRIQLWCNILTGDIIIAARGTSSTFEIEGNVRLVCSSDDFKDFCERYVSKIKPLLAPLHSPLWYMWFSIIACFRSIVGIPCMVTFVGHSLGASVSEYLLLKHLHHGLITTFARNQYAQAFTYDSPGLPTELAEKLKPGCGSNGIAQLTTYNSKVNPVNCLYQPLAKQLFTSDQSSVLLKIGQSIFEYLLINSIQGKSPVEIILDYLNVANSNTLESHKIKFIICELEKGAYYAVPRKNWVSIMASIFQAPPSVPSLPQYPTSLPQYPTSLPQYPTDATTAAPPTDITTPAAPPGHGGQFTGGENIDLHKPYDFDLGRAQDLLSKSDLVVVIMGQSNSGKTSLTKFLHDIPKNEHGGLLVQCQNVSKVPQILYLREYMQGSEIIRLFTLDMPGYDATKTDADKENNCMGADFSKQCDLLQHKIEKAIFVIKDDQAQSDWELMQILLNYEIPFVLVHSFKSPSLSDQKMDKKAAEIKLRLTSAFLADKDFKANDELKAKVKQIISDMVSIRLDREPTEEGDRETDNESRESNLDALEKVKQMVVDETDLKQRGKKMTDGRKNLQAKEVIKLFHEKLKHEQIEKGAVPSDYIREREAKEIAIQAVGGGLAFGGIAGLYATYIGAAMLYAAGPPAALGALIVTLGGYFTNKWWTSKRATELFDASLNEYASGHNLNKEELRREFKEAPIVKEGLVKFAKGKPVEYNPQKFDLENSMEIEPVR